MLIARVRLRDVKLTSMVPSISAFTGSYSIATSSNATSRFVSNGAASTTNLYNLPNAAVCDWSNHASYPSSSDRRTWRSGRPDQRRPSACRRDIADQLSMARADTDNLIAPASCGDVGSSVNQIWRSCQQWARVRFERTAGITNAALSRHERTSSDTCDLRGAPRPGVGGPSADKLWSPHRSASGSTRLSRTAIARPRLCMGRGLPLSAGITLRRVLSTDLTRMVRRKFGGLTTTPRSSACSRRPYSTLDQRSIIAPNAVVIERAQRGPRFDI
jgi:hypothetical protein